MELPSPWAASLITSPLFTWFAGISRFWLKKHVFIVFLYFSRADGTNTLHSAEGTRVIINSFKSHVIKVRVTKRAGQEKADLLSDGDEASSGIWNSITSSFSGSSTTESPEAETINIFSVASGHLYERLLRIMMLSLMKHTTSPVKFWFLKSYLSPQFIDILPHMANEYNFKYELVQYKWPRWLHQQTEKQRTIWGYKILFLDVLFPLDVKKIIFVDADAVSCDQFFWFLLKICRFFIVFLKWQSWKRPF